MDLDNINNIGASWALDFVEEMGSGDTQDEC
jgi:hypothetical protein